MQKNELYGVSLAPQSVQQSQIDGMMELKNNEAYVSVQIPTEDNVAYGQII